MLDCDLSLLFCCSLLAISSPAPSKTPLFLSMIPIFDHLPKEPSGIRISVKGLRGAKHDI